MSKTTFERAVSVAPRPDPEAHTPGPLALHGKMVSDTVETVGGMFCIRPIKHTKSVTGRPIIDYSAPSIAYAYSARDAELFAAAPDMLAALRALLPYAESRLEDIDMAEKEAYENAPRNVWEAARDDLAKARAAFQAAQDAISAAEGRR